jgi:DNA-binding LacI/PurR family transcriptional regulator
VNPEKPEKIDIIFIAKEANVSPATVSRVFNRSELVTAKTREQVLAICNKYNYKPSYLARSMRLKNTGYIGFLLPDFDNFFYFELLKSADYYATRQNYHFVLFNYENDYSKLMKLLDILTIRKIDGVLFGWLYGDERDSLFVKEVKNKNIPCVIVEKLEEELDTPYVGINNFKGGSIAANYLIKLNHKKIGTVTYDLNVINMKSKCLGFKKILDSHNLKEKFCIEIPTDIEFLKIKEELNKSINILLREDITAIFVTSDYIAINLVEILKENKRRIPDDISIISFDDITFAKFVEPKLTTISMSPNLMGESLARLLIEMIKDKDKKIRKNIILEPKLIIRDSCKAI